MITILTHQGRKFEYKGRILLYLDMLGLLTIASDGVVDGNTTWTYQCLDKFWCDDIASIKGSDMVLEITAN